jgi:hypothetical protein
MSSFLVKGKEIGILETEYMTSILLVWAVGQVEYPKMGRARASCVDLRIRSAHRDCRNLSPHMTQSQHARHK